MKIAHVSIRSHRNKTDFICLEEIDDTTIDMLTLSETWLDSSVCNAEIELPGFCMCQVRLCGI